jgi:PhnB protein
MNPPSDRLGPEETSIVPQLSVRRGRAAVDFYKAAFGAVEDYRVGGTDDHESVVAQLSVGTGGCSDGSRTPSATIGRSESR